MSIKIPSLSIKTTTLNAPLRKLNATWTIEMEKDLVAYHTFPGDLSPADISYLCLLAERFSEKYPIGSKVNVDVGQIVNFQPGKTFTTVTVTSIAVPLLKKKSVVFLCNMSQDGEDFYHLRDTLEGVNISKEVLKEQILEQKNKDAK